MELKRLSEVGGFVQYDGDEPEANRDYSKQLDIDSFDKRHEHDDMLRGEYRTDNTEKVVDAINKYMKKAHPKEWDEREKKLGEVTAATVITSEKIKAIIDILKDREDSGYILYDTNGNPTDRVTDWLSATKNKR